MVKRAREMGKDLTTSGVAGQEKLNADVFGPNSQYNYIAKNEVVAVTRRDGTDVCLKTFGVRGGARI